MKVSDDLKDMINHIIENNRMGDDNLPPIQDKGEILKDQESGIDNPFTKKNHFQLVVRNILSIMSTLGALLYIILDKLQIL